MAAELQRQQKHNKTMRLVVVSIGLLLIVSAALLLGRLMHLERAVGAGHPNETSAPALQPSLPPQTPPSQAIATDTFPDKSNGPSTAQPQQPPPQVAVPDANNPAIRPSTASIDPQEVQRALNTLAPHSQAPAAGGPSPSPAAGASVPYGSDRYPGSQPVEVKEANLPDIGIPVAREVYTTTDSVSTVIAYYRQLYPDAEVSEVNGQKIVAVDHPGATKVIAIGTTGSETRIAIVQPAN
jgi:hypothetical protein